MASRTQFARTKTTLAVMPSLQPSPIRPLGSSAPLFVTSTPPKSQMGHSARRRRVEQALWDLLPPRRTSTQARRMWKMHQASEGCPPLGAWTAEGSFWLHLTFCFCFFLISVAWILCILNFQMLFCWCSAGFMNHVKTPFSSCPNYILVLCIFVLGLLTSLYVNG